MKSIYQSLTKINPRKLMYVMGSIYFVSGLFLKGVGMLYNNVFSEFDESLDMATGINELYGTWNDYAPYVMAMGITILLLGFTWNQTKKIAIPILIVFLIVGTYFALDYIAVANALNQAMYEEIAVDMQMFKTLMDQGSYMNYGYMVAMWVLPFLWLINNIYYHAFKPEALEKIINEDYV